MNGVRLYFRYLAVSVRAQMQYKLSFVMYSFGHFAINGIEFLGVWALFARFDRLLGWTLGEVAVFYGLANMVFAFADALARGFDVFASLVKSGEFDTILTRPRSTVLQVIGREVTLRRVGRLAQGALVLAFGAVETGLRADPAAAVLIALVFVNGVAFFTALVVFQATASFWTVESLEVFNSLTYGGVHASQYPLNVYRDYFQKFFLFVVPMGAVMYVPVCTLLGREAFPGLPLEAGFVTPFAGIVFFGLAALVWRLGVRHYRSTGS